jgi:hypothetical protein
MRKLVLTSATIVAIFALSTAAVAADDDKGMNLAIEASVAYALQHVKDSGTYHSVLVSPQATFYWGSKNGSGPFITLGDALFSSIIGGPSDAKPTDATKISAAQVYALVGYRFQIIEPATKLNIGIGYLNQKTDNASDKYGHGPFFNISISIPILDVALRR